MLIRKCSLLAFLLAASSLLCQAQKAPEAENRELQSALAETTNSPSELIRTLERHLQKYPNSTQRDEIERAITKAAMESNDKPRILLYGERALQKNMDQPLILERVSQILLESDDPGTSAKALKYSVKFEEILRALEKEGPSSKRNRAQLLEELDRALGRSLLLQARATGNLGKTEEAIALAQNAWSAYPSAAAARELARWEAKTGKSMEAVRHYADAFVLEDPKTAEPERAKDRAKMAELYRKEKGNETGLGDLVLQAYDKTAAMALRRTERQRQRDPNAEVSDPMQFTISSLDGSPLRLASLKGKVIVLDFWATWCGPCRAQHPLYEEVRKRFGDRDDIVFLPINTDEDTSAVKPFIEQNKWGRAIWFEDGLGSLLRVSSIPTTIIIDKQGKIFTRMNGFVPEKFVDQLTERIKEALDAGPEMKADKRG